MVTKEDCVYIFNAMIRETPISFRNKLLPLISDYLTEIKYENPDKIIYLILQNPQLVEQALPTIIEYYCRKYTIFSLIKLPGPNDPNIKQTILYYV